MEPLLTTEEAARVVGLSAQSLRLYRAKGIGPAFVKLGYKTVRYRREAVDAWVKARETGAGNSERDGGSHGA